MADFNSFSSSEDNNRNGDNSGRRPFFRRRKTCPFSGSNAPKIDNKDTKPLTRYNTDRRKIVPSRINAVSSITFY